MKNEKIEYEAGEHSPALLDSKPLSRRDEFAKAAMGSLLWPIVDMSGSPMSDETRASIAKDACRMADILIAELDKEKNDERNV